MNRNQSLTFVRKAALACLALCAAPLAIAQSPANLAALVQGLTSPDVKTRVESFSDLFYPGRTSTSPYLTMKNLLRAHPAEAERIKTGMITALEMVQPYLQELRKRNAHFDEALSDYYGDLVGAVASLRNARALQGLLGAIDTGGMAIGGLADLGPAALDALIEKSRDADFDVRASAMSALGTMLTRLEILRSSPGVAAKARQAILAGLDDRDQWVRQSALSAASVSLEDPETRAKIESVASTDPEPGPAGWRPFPVRVAAADVLKVKPEGLFYVMRAPESRECRVQQASEPPLGVRFIGPNPSRPVATLMMCTHYDDMRKEPSLCWSVQPGNACGR